MASRTVPASARVIACATLVGVASLVSTLWEPSDRKAPRPMLVVGEFMPPIFSVLHAQAPGLPETTGCTGNALPNDPLLGGQSGVLSITMNKLSLVSTTGTEVSILSSPKDLNFAAPAGVNVGDIVNGARVAVADYSQMKVEMDHIFRILCAVRCDTNGDAVLETWLTKGGTNTTTPDSTAGPAAQSSLSMNNNAGPQTFTLTFPSLLKVTADQATQAFLAMSATGACELWDLKNGSHKILPRISGNPSAE